MALPLAGEESLPGNRVEGDKQSDKADSEEDDENLPVAVEERGFVRAHIENSPCILPMVLEDAHSLNPAE
jgi:hypothetical protein